MSGLCTIFLSFLCFVLLVNFLGPYKKRKERKKKRDTIEETIITFHKRYNECFNQDNYDRDRENMVSGDSYMAEFLKGK
jgi:hypothetical protein